MNLVVLLGVTEVRSRGVAAGWCVCEGEGGVHSAFLDQIQHGGRIRSHHVYGLELMCLKSMSHSNMLL